MALHRAPYSVLFALTLSKGLFMRTATRISAAFVASAAVLTVTACSSSKDSTASSGTSSAPMSMSQGSSRSQGRSMSASSAVPAADHNQADVTFAGAMIAHHGQAIAMANLAVQKADNGQVKQLATQIKAAQGPEITTMSGWLKSWNAPVPSASMSGMDVGGMSMTGMMSAAEMKQLENATGAAFDKLWLQLMTKHHQGAIAMARTELASGRYQPATTLAQSISTSQAKEVTAMHALLSSLG